MLELAMMERRQPYMGTWKHESGPELIRSILPVRREILLGVLQCDLIG